MQFLGSVRLDGSKRITLIKEVADILELGPQDHVMFYIDNGEVILRRVLPESSKGGIRYNNDSFWEWARKRQIEIGMMEPEQAEVAQAELSGKNPIPAGMSKQDYMELKFGEALSEQDDYDLLVMGHTQGKGCYCFVNGLLTTQIARYAKSYRYIVVDNEAGMEHISRGILPSVDTIILVSDCSRRGVQAVGRIAKLIPECGLKPKMVGLIVNRAPGGVLNEGTKEEIEKQGLTLLGVVPQDEQVFDFDCEGRPTVQLPEDSPVRKALYQIIDGLDLS